MRKKGLMESKKPLRTTFGYLREYSYFFGSFRALVDCGHLLSGKRENEERERGKDLRCSTPTQPHAAEHPRKSDRGATKHRNYLVSHARETSSASS